MRMSPQPSFAPDGMSGASGGESERFAGIRRDTTPRDVTKLAGDPPVPALNSKVVNHDDGLVHGHAWASSPSNWD